MEEVDSELEAHLSNKPETEASLTKEVEEVKSLCLNV